MNQIGKLNQIYEFNLHILKDGETVFKLTTGAGDSAVEIERAIHTINRILESYAWTDRIKPPNVHPDIMAGEEKNPAHTAQSVKPVRKTASPPAKAAGITGALLLECPECGRIFGTFRKEPTKRILCNCGNLISLSPTDMAKYCYTCKCGRTRYGMTNRDATGIEVHCDCGQTTTLTWDGKSETYHD